MMKIDSLASGSFFQFGAPFDLTLVGFESFPKDLKGPK